MNKSGSLWLHICNHPRLFCLHMHPNTVAALLKYLADRIEDRAMAALDCDSIETAEWLRYEASLAETAGEAQ